MQTTRTCRSTRSMRLWFRGKVKRKIQRQCLGLGGHKELGRDDVKYSSELYHCRHRIRGETGTWLSTKATNSRFSDGSV
jgi:hypothetical protein